VDKDGFKSDRTVEKVFLLWQEIWPTSFELPKEDEIVRDEKAIFSNFARSKDLSMRLARQSPA
jgi:hypothetical protein